MEFVVEVIALVVTGWVAGTATRRLASRRAALRSDGLAGGAGVSIPCRLNWKSVTGTRGFVYGKLGSDTLGPCFTRPRGLAIRIPAGGRAAYHSHWRPGMGVLEYRTPEGDKVRFLCYSADCDMIVRLLKIPNPDDFR